MAVHYPAAHPSGVELGYVVDGFGHPGHARTDYEVAACQAYTTAEVEAGVQMDHDGGVARQSQRGVVTIRPLSPAEGWTGLPHSHAPPLESLLEVHARLGGDVTRFHILALDSHRKGYDRVVICRSKDPGTRVAEAEVSNWSDWAVETFRIDGRDQRASVRFKLLELSPDGKHLKLYRLGYLASLCVLRDLCGASS